MLCACSELTINNGLQVIDERPLSESPVLYGAILRAHLIELLKKKAFLSSPEPTGIDVSEQFSAVDFAKKGSGNADQMEENMLLDLRPFTSTSPYTVVETMSLAKALILVREVGSRHLLVIPKIHRNITCGGDIDEARFHARRHNKLAPGIDKERMEKMEIDASSLATSILVRQSCV